jgi:hypothetical protein
MDPSRAHEMPNGLLAPASDTGTPPATWIILPYSVCL